jgi:Chlorophyll A-B binding protein
VVSFLCATLNAILKLIRIDSLSYISIEKILWSHFLNPELLRLLPLLPTGSCIPVMISSTYAVIILSSFHLFICESFRVPSLSEELGCSPTLSIIFNRSPNDSSNKLLYFDPLNIATDANFSRLREAEYKHGRVAMLAMLEIMLVPVLKRADFIKVSLGDLSQLSEYDKLRRISNIQIEDFSKVLVTCALLEIFVFVQKDPSDMPGDYGIGFLGLRDKGAHETQLTMELEHGRLAMVSFLAYLILDVTLYQNTSWLEQWVGMISRIGN